VHLKRTLFVSDLHLDEERPAAVARFARFLGEAVPGADALYILGDLFEYWVGDDGLALPFPAQVASMLSPVARAIPTYFHARQPRLPRRGALLQRDGHPLAPDPTVVDLYGEKTLLVHGDTLCTDDTQYQAFRAQVRNPAWQAAALARPLNERVAIARGMRSDSEAAKDAKSAEIMDVAPAAVEEAFERSGCRVMIHGHTHRPGRHVHRCARRGVRALGAGRLVRGRELPGSFARRHSRRRSGLNRARERRADLRNARACVFLGDGDHARRYSSLWPA
jgi:UDP-2,3-diacylglucosamine hydrolase